MTTIKVDNLGKRYIIGQRQEARYDTLRSAVVRAVRKRLPGRARAEASQTESFWALRNVSFSLQEGERLGIIGRNGAGKSTLLKLLSRITDPSEGCIRLRGRVSSLLEVGTGFHPELTGRENIYLNGAILGMRAHEIRSKFDAIVAFAEIEKFLDTPVKRFSSGMYVRLAFAVAAHLDPEILVVDEVLAVGDAQFQKKCLGKMKDIGGSGRTVLFVSHNMAAIEQMCSRCVVLQKGQLLSDSTDVSEAVRLYLASGEEAHVARWDNANDEFRDSPFQPSSFWLGDKAGNAIPLPARRDAEVWVHVAGQLREQDEALQIGYGLFSEDGHLVYWSCTTDTAQEQWPQLVPGPVHVKSRVPMELLNEGDYRLGLLVALYFREWIAEPGARGPEIILPVRGALSESPYWVTRRPGLLAPAIRWVA